MQTKISFTTLMAIAIQVICSGQQNETQSDVKNKINPNSSIQKINSKSSSNCDSKSEKILPILPINALSKANNTLALTKSEIIQQLTQTSDHLSSKAQSLRATAKTAAANYKQRILEQAKDFDQKSLVIQLQVCELNAEMNLYHYDVNKITIKIMINEYKGDKNTLSYTYNLIFESEKEMKLAKELREEAHAQPNLASIIGNMGNAEEKELLALSKQNLAIDALASASNKKNHNK